MPTKWLQERGKGSKNGDGIGFEGPGVEFFLRYCRKVLTWLLERVRQKTNGTFIVDKPL